MITIARSRVVAGFLTVFMGCEGACIADTRTLAAEALTSTHVTSSAQALQRYETSHSLDDLETAEDAMDGSVDVQSLTPDNFIATRRAFVQGWANVLALIEKAYEPGYDPLDPKNRPQGCIIPPREPDGRSFPPCTDPKEISDTKARAQYVAAIQADKLKTERERRYRDITFLDQRAMASLRVELDVFRDVAPAGAGADYAAIDSILKRAGLSSAHRSTIDGYLYYSPGLLKVHRRRA
jgi:hypothetical protein